MGGMVPVFNPGRVAVLLDSTGRTLGGGEWGEGDPSDSQTAHALNVGLLVEVAKAPAEAPKAAAPVPTGDQK